MTFSRSPRLGRSGAAAALTGALTLHNLEEAVGYRALEPRIVERTGLDVWPQPLVAALILLTAAGAACWPGRRPVAKRG